MINLFQHCLSIFSIVYLFSGAQALAQATFGEGIGRIWLDNVQCTGSERHLSHCMANSSRINSCMHTQDAGVRCQLGKGHSVYQNIFY